MLTFIALMLVATVAAASGNSENIEQTLRAQLEEERALYHFPGATAAFLLPDGSKGSVAVGLSDVERGLDMSVASRMPAGSIGKTFVAALTVALVTEGKLSLDDRLSRWLGDEAWFSRLPNGADIKIRNLLNHSAGIKNHVELTAFAELVGNQVATDPRTVIEPRVLVGLILNEPPLFPAGEGYAYTDTGYILLQLVLEKAGGFQLGEEVMRRFIYPLQLLSTGPADGVMHTGLAQGYVDTQKLPGLPSTTLDNGIFRWNPMSEWAGGGFISTSLDLVEWLTALFDGRAISPEAAAQMVSAANINTSAEGSAYGLGIGVLTGEWGRIWRHQGIFPGYRSSVAYYPDCRISLALQINTDRLSGEEFRAIDHALADALFKQFLSPSKNCAAAD